MKTEQEIQDRLKELNEIKIDGYKVVENARVEEMALLKELENYKSNTPK